MNERFKGVVLYKRPYRDHDALVKIFTREFGKKMFFIRHLQKPNQPLVSQTLPLTHHQYIGIINEEGLSFLKEGQSIAYYQTIQSDPLLQAYAAYFVQLIDAAIEDNQVEEKVYYLLVEVLNKLEAGVSPAIMMAYVQLFLLPYFGVYMHWQNCVICQQNQGPMVVSIRHQGVLCQNHASTDSYHLSTEPRVVHLAQMLVSHPLSAFNRIEVSQTTEKSLLDLLNELYNEFVGIHLKSKRYLNQILKNQQLAIEIAKKRKNQNG